MLKGKAKQKHAVGTKDAWWRLTKHKPGLQQSGPGLLLVSGLRFALGQSCFA